MSENPVLSQKEAQPKGNSGKLELTEELVEKIAERVYKMLMEDIKLEYERGRGYLNNDFHRGYR